MKCGERYEEMIDHRSYIHNSFSGFNFATAKVVCVTATINHFFRSSSSQFTNVIFHRFICKVQFVALHLGLVLLYFSELVNQF